MVTEDSVSQEDVTRGHLVAETHFDELAQRYVEMPTRTIYEGFSVHLIPAPTHSLGVPPH